MLIKGGAQRNQGSSLVVLDQSETADFPITAGSGTQPVRQMKIGPFLFYNKGYFVAYISHTRENFVNRSFLFFAPVEERMLS